jgi:hypothetical protein
MADVLVARGTGNLPANLHRPDVAQAVAELEPSSAPLTVLTNRLNSRPTHNVKFNWWEEELEIRIAAVEGAVTSNATTVNVEAGQGTRFAPNNLVLNTATGELFRVSSVATDALTVVRGVGASGSGIAMSDADELLVVSIAMEEGADWAAARSKNPVEKTNYTQIFETPYESTGSLIHADQWTKPHDFDRKARIAGIEHAKDHEYAAWHGKAETVAGTSHPRRSTGGFFSFVTTNVVDTGGGTTEAEFFAGLSGIFRYCSGERVKWGFGARIPVDILNSFPRGKLQIQQGEKTYGLRVMRYISPHGDLNLVTHWLFGDTSKFNKYIAILDMGNVAKRYLANDNGSRDTHTEDTPNTGDRTKKVLLTECGFEFKLDKTHGYFNNINA